MLQIGRSDRSSLIDGILKEAGVQKVKIAGRSDIIEKYLKPGDKIIANTDNNHGVYAYVIENSSNLKKSVVSSVIKNQKSFKEFNTFENNIQPGDSYTIRNVKGEDGKIYDLKLIFKGLSSSWTNNNWKVVQIYKGKKTVSKTMKEKDLYKFLELNNLSDK